MLVVVGFLDEVSYGLAANFANAWVRFANLFAPRSSLALFPRLVLIIVVLGLLFFSVSFLLSTTATRGILKGKFISFSLQVKVV